MVAKEMRAFKLLLAAVLMLATPLIAASCQKEDPEPPVQQSQSWGQRDSSGGFTLNPQMSPSQVSEGIQARLNDAAPGSTITVAGNRSGLDEAVEIIIPAGVTLEWSAVCQGAGGNGAVLLVGGQGTLRVLDGAVIGYAEVGIDTSKLAEGLEIIIDGGDIDGNVAAIRAEGGGADVTINDGVIISFDSGLDDYHSAVRVSGGSLTINGGNLLATGSKAHAVNVTQSATCIINDGDLMVAEGDEIAVVLSNNSSLTINGGQFTASGEIQVNAVLAFSGELVIEDGTFNTFASSGQAVYAGIECSATINGGQFTAYEGISRALYINEDSSCTVNGGVFETHSENSSCAWVANNSVLSIRGGSFTARGTGGIGVWVRDSSFYLHDGTITVTDSTGIGMYIDGDIGWATIWGGKLTAPDTGWGINIAGHGFAAYLTGTVTGKLTCNDGTDCLIVEVDALTIDESRAGTAEGLTVKSANVTGDHSVSWLIEDGYARLLITYGEGAKAQFIWYKY